MGNYNQDIACEKKIVFNKMKKYVSNFSAIGFYFNSAFVREHIFYDSNYVKFHEFAFWPGVWYILMCSYVYMKMITCAFCSEEESVNISLVKSVVSVFRSCLY